MDPITENALCIYILLLNNGNLYTGYTKRLEKRTKEHEKGKVRSTKSYRPVQLLHYEVYKKDSDARRREKFLKTTEGKRLLRMQIRDLLREKDISDI